MEAPIVDDEKMPPTRLRAAVLACAVLAVTSTGLSVSISAASGWSRGDTGLNGWLWAALGVLATFSAHLLPAAARLGNWRIKALTACKSSAMGARMCSIVMGDGGLAENRRPCYGLAATGSRRPPKPS